jgi:nucleotidyltransferase/DNA polymerase involved in DNA repair
MPGVDFREAALRGLQGDLETHPDDFAEHTEIIEPLSLDEAYLDEVSRRHRLCQRSLQPGSRTTEAADAAKEGNTAARNLCIRIY